MWSRADRSCPTVTKRVTRGDAQGLDFSGDWPLSAGRRDGLPCAVGHRLQFVGRALFDLVPQRCAPTYAIAGSRAVAATLRCSTFRGVVQATVSRGTRVMRRGCSSKWEIKDGDCKEPEARR